MQIYCENSRENVFQLCLHDSGRVSRLLTGITVPILITLCCNVSQAAEVQPDIVAYLPCRHLVSRAHGFPASEHSQGTSQSPVAYIEVCLNPEAQHNVPHWIFRASRSSSGHAPLSCPQALSAQCMQAQSPCTAICCIFSSLSSFHGTSWHLLPQRLRTLFALSPLKYPIPGFELRARVKQ